MTRARTLAAATTQPDAKASRLKQQPGVVVHLGYAVPRAGIPSAASFRRWVAAALRGAKRRRATELSIRIVGVDEGRTLNREYRGKDYATNVLSFGAELPPGVKLPLIGDMVICAPVVAREAAEQDKRERDHWAHLTVHSTLHLLGYDHVVDTEAEVMEALEVRILATLGIADPYADEQGS
ncbi:MAG TPA: rRNA maturation RNase YbeY [Rhodanobacter sp.]|nr:rRNA maturation RNase YbeY [Rhodanobacter sp.]